jgi:DNA-binding response OmpR family regulator
MQPTLQDRSILIVEDEPMIAMDVAHAFESAGAATSVTSTLHNALILVENEKLSAAVLDHMLPDGESSPLCKRLEERGLPFVVYSGVGEMHGPCALGTQVTKPESSSVLVSMVAKLLEGTPTREPRPSG